jgi:hypothetical protein
MMKMAAFAMLERMRQSSCIYEGTASGNYNVGCTARHGSGAGGEHQCWNLGNWIARTAAM